MQRQLTLAKTGSRERCTFHTRATDTRALVTGPAAHTCGECLRICREVLEITAA